MGHILKNKQRIRCLYSLDYTINHNKMKNRSFFKIYDVQVNVKNNGVFSNFS